MHLRDALRHPAKRIRPSALPILHRPASGDPTVGRPLNAAGRSVACIGPTEYEPRDLDLALLRSPVFIQGA